MFTVNDIIQPESMPFLMLLPNSFIFSQAILLTSVFAAHFKLAEKQKLAFLTFHNSTTSVLACDSLVTSKLRSEVLSLALQRNPRPTEFTAFCQIVLVKSQYSHNLFNIIKQKAVFAEVVIICSNKVVFSGFCKFH